MRRLAALAIALIGFATSASAYYHYLHYAKDSNTPIPEKFDLAALHNKTLYYFVADAGPVKFAENDNYSRMLSLIREAGSTWSGVGSSDLRVEFGGLFTRGGQQAAPHMEVVFEDLPPGVLGYGGPTSRADSTAGGDNPFVPILRSTVILPRDFSVLPTKASIPNDTLAVMIHEMGHALGLQHTFTSSAMSTEFTRATTRSKPLGADDVAAISVLYPAAGFTSQTGSISGRVTMDGLGVNMASVVALTSTGPALSALTNPDGSYKIDGMPPGPYFMYVHALPPSLQSELGPAEIVLPLDANGQSIPAGDPFRTQFYPGTQDQGQATRVTAEAGATTTGIDFAVERRGAPQLYGVTVYSFVDQEYHAVRPAYENISYAGRWLVATGAGLMPNGSLAPNLSVSILGDAAYVAPDGVLAYSGAPHDYLEVDFLFTPFSGSGPRHLVFSAGDELYVLPSSVALVNQQPPWIDSVTTEVETDGSQAVAINGVRLTSDTRILFDGLPAIVNSVDEKVGKMLVTPPVGASGYKANVVAYNSDGQTSLFWQDPPTFTYATTAEASFSMSVTSLPAGSEAMVIVDAANTNFVDGQVSLGFGSSDVWVKRLWVLSPTRLRAEVVVAASAAAGNTLVSLTSGFQTVSQPQGFQVLAANQNAAPVSDLTNAETHEPWVYPGVLATLAVANLAADSHPTITLDDNLVQVVSVAANQVTFRIPANQRVGVVILKLSVGTQAPLPIAVVIDPPPPVITSVLDYGVPVDKDHPVSAGDFLAIVVSGLGDLAANIPAEHLHIKLGGVDHATAGDIVPAPDNPGQHQIQIRVSDQVAAGPQPLTVAFDYRTSAPFTVAVQVK